MKNCRTGRGWPTNRWFSGDFNHKKIGAKGSFFKKAIICPIFAMQHVSAWYLASYDGNKKLLTIGHRWGHGFLAT
jgi:hypothetical protein